MSTGTQNLPKKLTGTFRKFKLDNDFQNLSGEFNTRKFVLNRDEQKLSYSSTFTKTKTFRFDEIEYVLPNISAQMKKPIGEWVHTLFIKFRDSDKNLLIATNKKEISELWTCLFFMENKINLITPHLKHETMSGVLVQMQNLPSLQIILEMSKHYEDDSINRNKNGWGTPNSFVAYIQEQRSIVEQPGNKIMFHGSIHDTGLKSQAQLQNNALTYNIHLKNNEYRKSRGSNKAGSSIFRPSLLDMKKGSFRLNNEDHDEIPEEGNIRQIHKNQQFFPYKQSRQQNKKLFRKVQTFTNDEYLNPNYYENPNTRHSKTFTEIK